MATISPTAVDREGVVPPHRLHGSWRRGVVGSAFLAALLIADHVLVRAQGARWASPLVVGEWLFTVGLALLILVLSLALGRVLARPLLSRDDPVSDRLAALGIGFGALSLGILGLGALHLYYGLVFLAAALAMTFALRRELAALQREASATLASWREPRPPLARTPGQRVLLILFAITVLFVCVRNTIPVIGDVPDLDGVTYHLSAPKLYLADHRIEALPDIPLANAPSGIEMLAVAGMAAGTDTLMKVLNLFFALLLGMATYALGRSHFDPRAALFGVFLLFTPFWVIELMPGTVPDFGTAFFLVLGVSDCLAWLNRTGRGGRAMGRRAPRLDADDRLLIRSGVLIGISISCKLTSGPALPALALTLGLACLAQRGSPFSDRMAEAVRACTVLCVAAMAPLGPWLLKNLILFRNPLYPAAALVNGADCGNSATGCAAYAHHASTGLLAHIDPLWTVVTTTADICWRYAGPPSVALLLTPLVLRQPAARQALLFLAIGAVLWLKLVPLFLPPRYWLGLIAVAEVVTAATLWELVRRLPLRPALADLPLVLYLAPAGLLTLSISIGLAQRAGAFELAAGSISRHDYLFDRVRPYGALDWANAHLPSDATIVTINTSLGYYLDRPYLNDWYGTRFNRLRGDAAIRAGEIAGWCRAGVRYAVFNRGLKEYNIDSKAGIRPPGAYAWTRLPGLDVRVLYSRRGADVLSLRPCAASPRGKS